MGYVKGRLPRKHIWEYHFARREGKRDRTNGGFIIWKRNDASFPYYIWKDHIKKLSRKGKLAARKV